MTIYKAELINLRNDGLTSQKIADLLNIEKSKIDNYFVKDSIPKDETIVKLENLYFERVNKLLEKARNPKLKN